MNFTEDNISQIPALRLLVTLGYTYLTPAEAMALRDGKNTSVLLEPVLKEQLKKINDDESKSSDKRFTCRTSHHRSSKEKKNWTNKTKKK